jgi:hypothetical protein
MRELRLTEVLRQADLPGLVRIFAAQAVRTRLALKLLGKNVKVTSWICSPVSTSCPYLADLTLTVRQLFSGDAAIAPSALLSEENAVACSKRPGGVSTLTGR